MRKVSPLEVMQAVLARIDAVNPTVNAYVTVAPESALAEARQATRPTESKGRGRCLRSTASPVSIKDLFATKGIRSTWGSLIYKDYIPDADDLVVQRLKAAGAIVVDKTNTPEFGAGGNTFNAVFGATRNPWNPALTSGGSSGGAAVAVATVIRPLAQGLRPRRVAPGPGGLLWCRRIPRHAGSGPVPSSGAGLGHPRGHRAYRAHGRRHGPRARGHGTSRSPGPTLV